MTTADSSTKEKRNAYMKIYRLKNKEKVKESQKRWRQNNPGRIAEYNKIWRQKNPELKAATNKKWRTKNSETVKSNHELWKKENPDYFEKYYLRNHDKYAIANWKTSGIKLRDGEDWDSVYLQWFTQANCTDCQCELTYRKVGSTWRCLDHDHETGFIRDIVCHRCNILRG